MQTQTPIKLFPFEGTVEGDDFDDIPIFFYLAAESLEDAKRAVLFMVDHYRFSDIKPSNSPAIDLGELRQFLEVKERAVNAPH